MVASAKTIRYNDVDGVNWWTTIRERAEADGGRLDEAAAYGRDVKKVSVSDAARGHREATL